MAGSLPFLAGETFAFLTIYLHFLVFLGRRGPAPGLSVAGDHAARENVEDRIVFDRAHEVGRLHDLVGGV